ncbi:MAG: Gfo/Idh/MocA family oxidoreductase [Actinobacteria bacterium]|nr:Gfo/Idh/MocA family oxidoreductase [Actinomycetota bacterium]
MNSLRILLVGCGRIGTRHAENLKGRVSGATLAGVVDPLDELATNAGRRFRVPSYPDFASALKENDCDAVLIAAPTPSHVELSLAAAEAGRHIFCEKPVSFDPDSIRRVIDVCAAAGVLFQVGFHRRFDPDWSVAAARVHAGDAGSIQFYRASFRDMAPPPPGFLSTSGGLFKDLLIHDLDAARWLVGEIEEVSAFGSPFSEPEFEATGDIASAAVLLRFANGALGALDAGRQAHYGCECSAEIVGANATVRISRSTKTNTEWLSGGLRSVDLLEDLTLLQAPAYASELEQFADAVRAGEPRGAGGADALAAVLVARACEQAVAEGRSVRVDEVEGASL